MYNSVVKVLELRYIRTRDEQLNILRACHMDPTAGHLGVKKTVCRISERFMWKGIVKDVKSMVCYFCSFLCSFFFFLFFFSPLALLFTLSLPFYSLSCIQLLSTLKH